jgi:hypothetical protein
MPYKSVFAAFVIGAFALGFASSPAFSATLTTSIAVTAIVEAGCQVSPSPSGHSISALTGQRNLSTVSCSMAVPYQVVVALGSQKAVDNADSPSIDVARLSQHVEPGKLDLTQMRNNPYAINRIVTSDSGSRTGLSAISPSESGEGSGQTSYHIESGTLIMTVIF